METIHVTFDELTEQVAPVHSSSGPNPNLLMSGPISSGLSPTGDHQKIHVPVVPPLVIPTGPSVSISFDHDAPLSSHSPSSLAHQSSSIHHGVATEHSFEVNLFAATEHEPFVNVFAPDPHFKASTVQSQTKNFKYAITEDCWFQAIQDEIYEFDRLDVWELVPPPDYAMIIALKWIYKVKLDEYGDVLKNKARLVAKGY
ncbi:retrovirus-related pol polyprotein from transposon TNT 1-94 [Tanacetum coccineum]